MELTELINHPEKLDRNTLYELRSLLALYPYFQTARLLMLQNLYILHDATFDEELRRAAIYITDRKVLFQMIEAAHYKVRSTTHDEGLTATHEDTKKQEYGHAPAGSRTISLIDNFLESMPKDEAEKTASKRKPTPADAAVDYVAYLLETETEQNESDRETPQMRGQSLIDTFINNDKGKIVLSEEPLFTPQTDMTDNEQEAQEGYFTETLARIYIKQGRYFKALEIIKRLNLAYPKKNAYFADQIRFLEKLIINNNKNNK